MISLSQSIHLRCNRSQHSQAQQSLHFLQIHYQQSLQKIASSLLEHTSPMGSILLTTASSTLHNLTQESCLQNFSVALFPLRFLLEVKAY